MTRKARPPHKASPTPSAMQRALVDAGMALVREHGPEALSIRKVAARVGVSHAAPAHHFPNLIHLRTAVAAEAHRLFTQAMEDAIAEAPDTQRDALIGAGIGYLRFAHANPGLFHMMFGGAELCSGDPDLQQASAAAYGVLARVCAPVAHGPAGPKGTESLVWSLSHGFAALMLRGRFGSQGPQEAETAFRAVFPDLPFDTG